MGLIDCLTKSGVSKGIHEYVVSKREAFLKQGHDQQAADQKAINEFKYETVNHLADLHNNLAELAGNEKPFPVVERKVEPVKEVRKEPTKKEPGVMAKAKGIEDLTDPIDVVLQHFTAGGKIHQGAIKKLFGGKDERFNLSASTEGERRRKISLLSGKGKSIDELAHQLWEEQPEQFRDIHTTEHFRDAIETVLLQHNSPASMAKELVNKFVTRSIDEHLTESEHAEIDNNLKQQVIDHFEGLTEKQQNDILKITQKYQDQYGFVDWEKLEKDSKGFDAEILSLPEETQKVLDAAIQKNITTGQSERSNITSESGSSKISEAEGKLKSTQTEFDRATKELIDAENKIAKKQATQTGMFGEAAQKEMFGVDRDEAKTILDPLRQRVKETRSAFEKAKTDLDNSLAAENPDIFTITEKEKEIANDDIPESDAQSIIKSEGLTLENLDEYKHLFNGFPFEPADFEKVKTELNERGQSTSEPGANEQQRTGVPENKTAGDTGKASPQPETAPEKSGAGSASDITATQTPLEPDQNEAVTYKAGLSVPYVNELFEHDVNPRINKLGTTLKEALRSIINTISPKTGVSEKAIKHLMGALGERNAASAEVDKALSGLQKVFGKMKDVDRIAFIDKMKRGEDQITPQLQDVAETIKTLDKELYNEIIKYKPSLSWKENHYRVLWKVVPGSVKPKLWSSLTRRPLQGSKGFFKQATLADMSEGIARGGEPYSTNPIHMFKLAYADGMKYITAQRMFEALKGDKMIQFVKTGQKAPDFFVPIDDNISKVYFKSDAGMVKTGEYYIEEGAGRLLNNHLSRDLIREHAVGKGLMEIKNLYTQVELSLSGFHAIAEGLETVSSDLGLGIRKLVNLGLRGDFKSAGEGILDILKAPFSPKTTFTAGRNAIKFATVKDFETSGFGKAWLKKVPEARQYLTDFFNGGGLLKQNEDLRSNTFQALKDQVGKDNYIGAALRALPAMNEAILNPLFNHYIPALKVGMFFKEFPTLLKENEERIAKGQVTREQLARKSIDFIDDRLGELNFDNLFWNRTFKTTMQFMMRSVTWKLGNLRAMLGAPVEQAREFIDAAREKRSPILMPKMAWLFGLSAMQVALSTVIMKIASNKIPTSFKDIVAPQINPTDDKERVIMPTYYKDMLHLWHSRLGYITTSMSGPFSKLIDIWQNKDFYHYEIHDEHDSWLERRKDDLEYFIPKPFSISSSLQMIGKGEPPAKVAMSFFGLNKAPGYLINSDIENEIFDLYNIRNTNIKPQSQKEANDIKKQIRELYKEDKKQEAQKMASDAVKQGILRPTQIKYLFSHIGKESSPSIYFFKMLPYEDKKYLIDKMTKEERKIYDPKNKFK